MASDGIGASVKRKEDYRFITGGGSYTDDIDRPGQVYAYFVRSPHAHARINGIDKSRAEAAPGVLAVFDRRRLRGGQMGRADLRLDGQVQGRLGHEGRAAPDPGPGQGALRRRSCRAAWSPRPTIRPRTRPSWSRSTTTFCRLASRPRMRATAASRRSTTRSPATRSTSGSSATSRRSIRRSPAPPTSPPSSWSTTAWCRTRSSRARRSASTIAPPTASPSTPRARTRMSRGS